MNPELLDYESDAATTRPEHYIIILNKQKKNDPF